MPILKIIMSALVTASTAVVLGGVGSFFYVIVTEPKEAAAGKAVLQGALVGITAGIVGFILGGAGSLLFPDAYPKILAVVVLLVATLALVAWRSL